MKAKKITYAIFSTLGLSTLLLGCGLAVSNQAGKDLSANSPITNSITNETPSKPITPKAPAFILPTVDGRNLSLQQLLDQKKPIVVNYFASWCPPCNAEMPDFTTVSNQFSGKVLFLGVDAIGEDSLSGAKTFIKKYNIHFPVILDEKNILASQYGLVGHPETLIISANGTIAWAYPGPVTKNLLDQTLNQVLTPKSS